MMCDCQNRACIKVMVSPEDTGISIGIAAPVAGDYKVMLGFNGAFQKVILTLTESEIIILPNIVNGNYTHELDIYKPDGTLLNDTCYSLAVRSIYQPGNDLSPSQSAITKGCTIVGYIKDSPDPSLYYTLCNGQRIQLEYPSGPTLTISSLRNLSVNTPFYLAGGVEQLPNWNSSTATWDKSNNGGFTDSGDPNNPTVFTINYEQPIS